jgi:hypothetical protein
MRGKQLWAIVAGGVVALLAAIYFGVRSPGPEADASDASARPERAAAVAAEPAIDEPPATTQAPTQASAAEPIAVQASNPGNAFRELRQCVYASRDLVAAKQLLDCRSYEGQPQFEAALAECLNGRMNARNRVTAAEKVLSECDQADMGTRYFQATKEAAKRGDADAQLCYLQGDFFSPEGAEIFTDAELDAYKKLAPAYVDAALKRGDWRIVHLLNARHFHPGSGPVRLIDGIGDPQTRYKMTKLLRLGASGTYARVLESQLQSMIHPDLNPSAALPAKVVKEGDAWAQQTYIDYFAGVPGLTEPPVVCRPEPGKPGSLANPANPDWP